MPDTMYFVRWLPDLQGVSMDCTLGTMRKGAATSLAAGSKLRGAPCYVMGISVNSSCEEDCISEMRRRSPFWQDRRGLVVGRIRRVFSPLLHLPLFRHLVRSTRNLARGLDRKEQSTTQPSY